MAATMDRTLAKDAVSIEFPPARRFRYWPLSVLFLGLGGWVMWVAGLPVLLRDFGGPDWWPRFLVLTVGVAGFPILGAVVMLFVPFRRLRLTVGPDGLLAVTSHGRPVMRIDWGSLDRIVYRRPRSIGSLEFRFRSDQGRRLWRLRDDCYAGGPVALLTAIRDLAPEAGYALTGHRLDISHWGGEEWRISDDTAITRNGAPEGAPSGRPA
jgi:hypothetical protein